MKQVIAKRYNVDGTIEDVGLAVYRPGEAAIDHFDLKTLQGWVGGYIELIRHRRNDVGGLESVLVDEDGRSKGLPENPKATEEFWHPRLPLVGPVVAFYVQEAES